MNKAIINRIIRLKEKRDKCKSNSKKESLTEEIEWTIKLLEEVISSKSSNKKILSIH